MSEIDQKVLADVEEFGWCCMSVSAEADVPDYSYSVGWSASVPSPEAVVCGLPAKRAQTLLWTLLEQLADGDEHLYDGAQFKGLVKGVTCVARAVHPTQSAALLRFASWYNGLENPYGGPAEAFQIFYPDKSGKFPWDDGAAGNAWARQPDLSQKTDVEI